MRPNGAILANPQALAAVSLRKVYTGRPELGTPADPDTWLTPRYILDCLGSFDLDPCAAEQNPTWTGARNFYTKPDNGLVSPWHGRVFMNPPFSNTVPWIEKHAEHGIGISLVPSTLESKTWRAQVWKRAKAILILHGRTRFCNPDGSSTTGRPLRPVALIAWDEDSAQTLEKSPLAGVLLRNWAQR